MKQGDTQEAKNPEPLSAPPVPVKPKKQKKEKKEKKNAHADDLQLPVLVELTYTVSILLVIFVGLAMIVTSLLTGASLLNLIFRTSVAILVMGSLLLFISSQVSSGMLQASLVEQEEAQKAQTEGSLTADSPANLENTETAEAK